MNYRLTILSILLSVLWAQSPSISSLVITRKESQHHGCQIVIENTHEMLDLRSNCSFSGATQENAWKNLILSTKAYLIEIDGAQWKGYRYLKNPVHYKNVSAQFIVYQKLIDELLQEHNLNTRLIFGDKYTLVMEQGADKKWQIVSLQIDYTFNLIQKIDANPDLFDIKASFNKTSNVQQSFAIRRLSGKGLHQKVNLTIALDFETSLNLDNTCKVIIEQILPESTYIDADQLRSIKKNEVLNVELPESASKQYYYQYTIPFTKFKEVGSRRYNYQYPIHFRYPVPSHLNYTLVALHPSDSIRLTCNNGTTTVALPQDPFNNRGHASIFNGSSHDSKTVSMITFILMIVAATIIIKHLKKA